MKRWNGWGDEAINFSLPLSAGEFLAKQLGPGITPRDASLQTSVAAVPSSRLPAHHLVSTDPAERLLHSTGQSLHDWINIRSGKVPSFPDGVAYPASVDDVEEIIRYAKNTGASVIPYGGGTSVVGHLTAPAGERPVLTVDMNRMNGLVHMDPRGCLATFLAGVRGPDLEAALRVHGFTLGHFPQSFEFSTLGGWVSTRSAGQLSLGYGKIDRLFAGGTVITPAGRLDLPVFPASAAGPDLREFILGSEGRIGIIAEATIKISPLPESESFHAAFLPDPDRAVAAVRQMVQSSIPLAMIRLSLPEETRTNLILAGHSRLIDLLNKWLALRGVKDGKCMLLYGAAGTGKKVRWALRQASEIIRQHRGVTVGQRPGKEWLKNRFRAPYLRNSLWEAGYAVDTLETATTWERVPGTVEAIENSLRGGLNDIGESVHVFTHLSHVYPHGSSIYTTYLYRVAADPVETARRWVVLKSAASRAIVNCGGTISHQHGVGLDHLPYLEAEKGRLGMKMIGSLCGTLDPWGIMNPGKLLQ
ncbi:MAG: FAD-binding oxidoreductase [Bacillota bacterium]